MQQNLLKKVSSNIRFVLVEPSHPGNIGAVARAMKTMGLEKLVLVNPEKFPDIEATRRAAGAESVLEQALIVPTLHEAISDCDLVLGTSVRDREVSWSTITPRAAANKVVGHGMQQGDIALMFGRERSGLKNEELDLCQYQIRIPANEEYSSLNLASAVQILAYEVRVAMLGLHELKQLDISENKRLNKRTALATSEDLQRYYLHLEETLEQIDFIKNKPPTKLMRKIIRLYNRAQINVEEMQILRGILTAVQSFVEKVKSEK